MRLKPRKAFPTAVIVGDLQNARTALPASKFDAILSTTHLAYRGACSKDIIRPVLSIALSNKLPLVFVGTLTLEGRFNPRDGFSTYVTMRALSMEDVALSLEILRTKNGASNFARLEYSDSRTISVAKKNYRHWADARSLLKNMRKRFRSPQPKRMKRKRLLS